MEVDVTRPPKLYRYDEQRWLQRALTLGEFLLKPASGYKNIEADAARQDDELTRIRSVAPGEVTISNAGGQVLEPLGDVVFTSHSERDYLVICFSSQWFADGGGFKGVDACLVVHDTNALLERLHAEAESILPGWTNNDAPVSYGLPSPLGVSYSKPRFYEPQREFRFTARPPHSAALSPTLIAVGSIEDIAEVVRIGSL